MVAKNFGNVPDFRIRRMSNLGGTFTVWKGTFERIFENKIVYLGQIWKWSLKRSLEIADDLEIILRVLDPKSLSPSQRFKSSSCILTFWSKEYGVARVRNRKFMSFPTIFSWKENVSESKKIVGGKIRKPVFIKSGQAWRCSVFSTQGNRNQIIPSTVGWKKGWDWQNRCLFHPI